MTKNTRRFDIFLHTHKVTDEESRLPGFPAHTYGRWVSVNIWHAARLEHPSVQEAIGGPEIADQEAFDTFLESQKADDDNLEDIERWRDAQKVTTLSKTPPTLHEAQRLVGGLVEMVELPDGRQMLVNEEGLLYRLPYNAKASGIAGHPIAGPVVILEGTARWK